MEAAVTSIRWIVIPKRCLGMSAIMSCHRKRRGRFMAPLLMTGSSILRPQKSFEECSTHGARSRNMSTYTSPTLQIRRLPEGDRICCARCGYALAYPGRPWKQATIVCEIPTDELVKQTITGE